jgi:hypothetical protein
MAGRLDPVGHHLNPAGRYQGAAAMIAEPSGPPTNQDGRLSGIVRRDAFKSRRLGPIPLISASVIWCLASFLVHAFLEDDGCG